MNDTQHFLIQQLNYLLFVLRRCAVAYTNKSGASSISSDKWEQNVMLPKGVFIYHSSLYVWLNLSWPHFIWTNALWLLAARANLVVRCKVTRFAAAASNHSALCPDEMKSVEMIDMTTPLEAHHSIYKAVTRGRTNYHFQQLLVDHEFSTIAVTYLPFSMDFILHFCYASACSAESSGNLYVILLTTRLGWNSTGAVNSYHPRSKCHEDVANTSRGNRACRTCRTRKLRRC